MSKPKIHFLGIGGSGVSGVVQLALDEGYPVSGCDLQTDTPYLHKISEKGVVVHTGHDPKHLNKTDLLAVSPAAFFQKPLHPEVALGLKEKKVITWQKFLGQYLQKNKFVICVAGTHGKSTTTAMISLLLEDANLDPSVMVGATIPRWHSNARSGKSKYFVTESDEFYDNFLNYHPNLIILNNLEPDHPDYFKTQKQLFTSFRQHLLNLQGEKILIFNQDSLGIKKLFHLLPPSFFSQTKLIGYTLSNQPLISTPNSYQANILKRQTDKTLFSLNSAQYSLSLPGDFNVSNALGAITLGLTLKIPLPVIQKSLTEFTGIGRRLELICSQPITLYDDYAHHPTAIRLTLSALRQRHPQQKIFCVIEPHSFSRTKKLLTWYKNAFASADRVIIAPIFKARDTYDFHVSPNDIATISRHHHITTSPNFDTIIKTLQKEINPNDVIIVMGAGVSYQLTQALKAVFVMIKTLILGFGREGQSTLRYLLKSNPQLHLAVADKNDLTGVIDSEFKDYKKQIITHFGDNYLDFVSLYQLVYKTPGLSPHLPELAKLNPKTIITSNTRLFFEVARGQIIGVSGSKGKSTTTSLIHHVLTKNQLPAILIGNIGQPALDFLGENNPKTIYCFELSSFQLMDLKSSPHLAILQDIFPEHLDYHQNFAEYLAAKQNLARFQKKIDHFIYNADSTTASATTKLTSATLHPFRKILPPFLKPQDNPLLGEHNLYNLWPAIIVGQILGLSDEQIKTAIKSFTPLAHRLENCGTYRQITFINDSQATNPEATIAAIAAFPNLGTIILGGSDKNLDYSKLITPLKKSTVKNIIFLPPTGDKIKTIISPHLQHVNYFSANSMKQVIQLTYQHTPPNTICLLSTASPSFGLFLDYQDRGNQFKSLSKQLA